MVLRNNMHLQGGGVRGIALAVVNLQLLAHQSIRVGIANHCLTRFVTVFTGVGEGPVAYPPMLGMMCAFRPLGSRQTTEEDSDALCL